MDAIYDDIGVHYSATRHTDPDNGSLCDDNFVTGSVF